MEGENMKDNRVDPEFLAMLRKAELFSGLLDDDLSYIASRVEELSVKQGCPVFVTGEKARRFFIMQSGEVLVSRAMEGGRQEEMARYVCGDVLADFDFARSAVFDASARAIKDSVLIVFPGGGKSLDELAVEKPDVVARILLRSMAMIASRIRSTHKLISENSPWIRELRRQIYTDPATGLWSRAFLDEELHRSLEPSTALILMKPDRFKELVDEHGHQAGDVAMNRIADLLLDMMRGLGRGWAVRLRSNETALVIPAFSEKDTVLLAKRLFHGIRELNISDKLGGKRFEFGCSIAVGMWPDDGPNWQRLVEHAYGVLTRAWRDGGSRIYRARAAIHGNPESVS